MSLKIRKSTLLAKIESVYGTDPTPTGSANAMLVKNLTVNPIEAELVDRNLIRPFFGNGGSLLAQKYVTAEFEVEYVGSGTPGVAPAFDSLLRACAFTKASNTAAITSITRSGAVATLTRTSHGFIVGDSIKISGATEVEYNGTFVVATVPTANTLTYAVAGTPTTPATGTPVIGSTVVYTPVTDSVESATLYYNLDGVQHKMTGARGTVEMSVAVKQIPSFKFTFTGIYNAPSDVSAPSVDYSAFMIPQIANTQQTPSYSLLGYSASGLESMSLQMANDVIYKTLIGHESVEIVDRKPAGTLVFEAPTIAAKDFFTAVSDSTTGAFALNHGSKNGYKVNLAAPAILLGNPTYSDSDGIAMLTTPFSFLPVSGNDELSLTFA